MSITLIALEKDLFFAVKIRDTLRHHDMQTSVVRTLAAFEEGLTASPAPDVAVVDIATRGVDWEEAIRAARSQQVPVLAFGSHMDLEARAKALQAGALKVVANSKFASDMPGLLTRLLNTPTDQTSVDVEADSENEE
ncbi:hypothetical protein KDH_37120 [Dictyobacter sp. S3.2.2.5]|uniref:Response regulatory domain-containing protein n=1 Tax=Dictyobacter halimunensis TaxID=3026934 RepID=A0ABQ6FWF7_9CHLR|nr:hypothetical protein KDH_37120 [Dictyobacter sp. S3.2.2.5]